MLIDTFGRRHDNLRISVTDRCNLRCTYCMPEDVQFQPRSELLSFEEIAAFVRVIAPLGVDKIRLTGGEPLMRKDLARLVAMIKTIDGVKDIGLTTNGLLLAAQAQALFDAGLRRLNVSLDTLNPERFRALSRRDGVENVVAGLLAAKAVGFAPIKVNAVAVRGNAEHDIVPLARFCIEQGFTMRFIEFMPIGAGDWQRGDCVTAHEIMELLEAGIGPLSPATDYDPHAPAMEFEFAGGHRVGIIASVTRPFCKDCNRLRLTSDGKLRHCLFAREETDVKALLRQSVDTAALAAAIQACVQGKWAGHDINAATFVKPLRTMHAIGG
jgi:cyclic pyranopterin phosphate synthase